MDEYGITPHSGDDTNSADYLIEDIIGDSTPELLIYGYFTEAGGTTKDIYGYDNSKCEAFQYKGDSRITESHKGKESFYVSRTGPNESSLYSV